jgi:glycosyltransferase involved in cell wall biosynthesis
MATMKKKVLFLAAWYPTRYESMAGLFVNRHAELLTTNFDVTVLHALAVNSLVQKYETETRNENNVLTIRVYYRKVNTSISGINKLINSWRFFKAHLIGFKQIKAKNEIPSLIQVNILTRVGTIALYLKLRYKIPYVILEHWSRYLPQRGDYKGFLRKMATKAVVHYSSGISTVSEKLRQAMMDCGIKHSHFLIVHNAVDTNLFNYKEQLVKPQKLIFSHVSCFDDNAKNVTGILRAIHKLAQKRNDFICLMVGDGTDKQKAEQLAASLGILEKTVQFTGILEGDKLVEAYNQSLFTVLFSNYENMPVVISESFACGKPVVSSSVGGIPEIINKSTGILVPPKDEVKLSEAIEFMLDHHQDYNSNNIREYAINQFGNTSVLNQFLQLYEPVLGNSK